MRVIAGTHRSRLLKSLKGSALRPTSDYVRETLFNVLGPSVADSHFLDIFAGTGAVGIEALSRGALRAIFIEKGKNAARVIHENLVGLGIETRAQLVIASTATVINRYSADIVFLDPPYTREGEYAAALTTLEPSPPPLVVVQHSIRHTPADSYGLLRKSRTVKQGDNALTFFVY